MSIFGTRGSFEEVSGGQFWADIDKNVVDLTETLRFPKEPGYNPVGRTVSEAEAVGRYARVQEFRRLPREFWGQKNGHLGSHQFLVDDFLRAVVSGRLPALNAWTAAQYAVPGLVAHEPAQRGGALLEVPDLGTPRRTGRLYRSRPQAIQADRRVDTGGRQMNRTILIVDDDEVLRDLVSQLLRRSGFQALRAGTGKEGVEMVHRHRPDLVLLDCELPDIDGFDVLRLIRRASSVPVLLLTQRTEEVNRVIGLEIGADDYLVKPFGPAELVARVRAVLRRLEPRIDRAFEVICGNAVIDLVGREVRIKGKPIEVTHLEFALLEALVRNERRALSRRELVVAAWGVANAAAPRMVDVHLSNLRQKLGAAPDLVKAIRSVRGTGYKFVPGD